MCKSYQRNLIVILLLSLTFMALAMTIFISTTCLQTTTLDNSIVEETYRLFTNSTTTTRSETKRSDATTVTNNNEFFPQPFDGSTLRQSFVDKYCDLQGEPWLPDTPSKKWQYRAPYFVVPGVKKAGSSAITNYLSQHPNVGGNRAKELRTFSYVNIGRFINNDTGKILVKDMRRYMYRYDYNKTMLKNNPTLVAYDGTPAYMYFSSTVPYRLLCVAPWIKLVVILREPVERLYSNYNYVYRLVENRSQVEPFEEYLNNYMRNLRHFGLVRNWQKVDFSSYAGSLNEDKAWATYVENEVEGPIAKGMYEIQIRHWFRAFEELGRNPWDNFIFLKNEELRNDPTKEYHRALDFLGLPKHTLTVYDEKMKGSYFKPMTDESRQRMRHFYDKYNQRLYRLLRQKWEDWDGYWDEDE